MPTAEVDLDEFRATVRAWAQEHAPPRDWASKLRSEDDSIALERAWLRDLKAAGLGGAHWSKEWGAGLTLPQQVVMFEEFSAVDAPYIRTWFVALNHTYATLMTAGTDAQKKRHLPAILNADEIWCQGFSEPGAGSDLASLRTRAVRDGDEYVVNGQKVWSSGAMRADFCLLLARTDPDAPKRRGISYFLLDMRTPGVEARPIRQADGGAHFCELFLTDVRIPVESRVGEENDGWRIAQSTLTAERGPTVLELAERLHTAFGWLVELARNSTLDGAPAIADIAVRERLAALHTQVTVLGKLCRKVVEDIVTRGGPGPEASIIKIFYSELLQVLMDAGVELQGLRAQERADKPLGAGWESGIWLIDYIDSWAWITGGGTNEIQRSVVGERVLGLPREPSVG